MHLISLPCYGSLLINVSDYPLYQGKRIILRTSYQGLLGWCHVTLSVHPQIRECTTRTLVPVWRLSLCSKPGPQTLLQATFLEDIPLIGCNLTDLLYMKFKYQN